jgi:DNA polymerase III alpha subunit
VGEILWKILEDSANYSFNKSHSLAYAALAAVTIYLKFNYPQQFFLCQRFPQLLMLACQILVGWQ